MAPGRRDVEFPTVDGLTLEVGSTPPAEMESTHALLWRTE